MSYQTDCPPGEETERTRTADRTTLVAGERKRTGQTIPINEQGLERFLSRWLTMYTGVQELLRLDGRGF